MDSLTQSALFDIYNFAPKDVQLVCKDNVLEASRFLLSARSPVFRAMLSGNFKESMMENVELDFKEYSSQSVQILLDYINHGKMLDCTSIAWYILAEVYRMSDYWELPELLTSLRDKLIKCIHYSTDSRGSQHLKLSHRATNNCINILHFPFDDDIREMALETILATIRNSKEPIKAKMSEKVKNVITNYIIAKSFDFSD